MPTVVNNENGYNRRPVWQWIALYLVIGLLVYGLLYYYVLGKKSTNVNVYQPTQAPIVITTLPTLSPGPAATSSSSVGALQTVSPTQQAMRVAVNGTEFAFSPSTINAKVGQPLTIVFNNNGTFPHNLSIPDLNVKTKTISPGASDTITFTPDKAGTFQFVCTVPGHADRGMTGTLAITQ